MSAGWRKLIELLARYLPALAILSTAAETNRPLRV